MRPNRTYPALLLTALLLVAAPMCRAQHADSVYYKKGTLYYWGELMGGAGNVGGGYGVSANLLFNRSVIMARAYRATELVIFGPTPKDKIDHFALMAGRKVSHNKFGNYMVSAGVSINKILTRGNVINTVPFAGDNYQPVYNTKVGIPIEVKYHNNINLGGVGGFSCAAMADLHAVRPFYMLTFAIALGHLRERVKGDGDLEKPQMFPSLPHRP